MIECRHEEIAQRIIRALSQMTIAPGTRLGPYEIVGAIGAGRNG